MKQIYFLLFTLITCSLSINAQIPLSTFEESFQFGNKTLPAICVTIPEVGYETTMNAWIKEIESGSDSKVVSENNNLTLTGTVIKEIYSKPANVYSRISSQDSVIKLAVAFEVGPDKYIESSVNEREALKAKNYLKQFAKGLYIDLVKDQIVAQEKELKALEKQLSEVEKSGLKSQKSMQPSRDKIREEEENLTIQNNELNMVSYELVELKSQLNMMEPGPAKVQKEADIKKLEQRRKAALKSVKKSENKITKANNQIMKTDAYINKDKEEQEIMIEKVVDQKGLVKQYINKLNMIKKY